MLSQSGGGRTAPIERAKSIVTSLARKARNMIAYEISAAGIRMSVRLRFALLKALVRRDGAWPDALPELSVLQIYNALEAHYTPPILSDVPVLLVRASSGQGTDAPYREFYRDEDSAGAASHGDWNWSMCRRAFEHAAGAFHRLARRGHAEAAVRAMNVPAPRAVTIVIVTYRSADLTIDCLRSVLPERAASGNSLRAVVVDNASGDAPAIAAAIASEAWGSWVTLIEAPKNGGFAYGNNIGFAHACRDSIPTTCIY